MFNDDDDVLKLTTHGSRNFNQNLVAIHKEALKRILNIENTFIKICVCQILLQLI